jgi:hypothetical protein
MYRNNYGHNKFYDTGPLANTLERCAQKYILKHRQLELYILTMLEGLASDKHSTLRNPFVSYERSVPNIFFPA